MTHQEQIDRMHAECEKRDDRIIDLTNELRACETEILKLTRPNMVVSVMKKLIEDAGMRAYCYANAVTVEAMMTIYADGRVEIQDRLGGKRVKLKISSIEEGS